MLIGDFSPEDCDDYLARRLTREGQPLIGEPIRQVVTARSHGLPLYLDLSVARFLELRRSGRATPRSRPTSTTISPLWSPARCPTSPPTNGTSCAR